MSQTTVRYWKEGQKLKERATEREFKAWKMEIENAFCLQGKVGDLLRGDLKQTWEHCQIMAKEAQADWKEAEKAHEKASMLRKLKTAARTAEFEAAKAKSVIRKATDTMKAMIKNSLDRSCLPYCMTPEGIEFKDGQAMFNNIVKRFQGSASVDKLAAVSRVPDLEQGSKETITSYFQR